MFPSSSPLKEADRASLLDLGLLGRNSLDSPGSDRHPGLVTKSPVQGARPIGEEQNSPKAARGSTGDLCTQSNFVGSDCLFHLLKLFYSTCQV